MHPVLFSIGPLVIYTFGVFLAVAVTFGSFAVWKYGKISGFPDEKILDAITVVLLFGFLFSRLFYIFLHFGSYGFEIGKWVLFLRYPGLSYIGAFIGGFFALCAFSYFYKLAVFSLLDVFSLGLVLGKVFGDLGCFLNGCEVGVKTSYPWGTAVAGFLGARHPVSVYDSLLNLVFFLFLVNVFFRVKNWTRQRSGLVFLILLLLYGLSSVALEFFRENTLYFVGYKLGFVGGGSLVIVSLCLLYLRVGRSLRRDLKTFFGTTVKLLLRVKGLTVGIFRFVWMGFTIFCGVVKRGGGRFIFSLRSFQILVNRKIKISLWRLREKYAKRAKDV